MRKILSLLGGAILIYGVYIAYNGNLENALTGIADILLSILETGGNLVAALIEKLKSLGK